MSIGSFNLEREHLLFGGEITLKFSSLRILSIGKTRFRKIKYYDFNIQLNWNEKNIREWDFVNFKRPLSSIEGSLSL